MIKLSLEMPSSRLQQWTPLVDLDFVLAHKVLEDEAYAQFFLERDPRREVILDNSTHEFGKPLPMGDLLRAARLCKADCVIAPDIVNPNIDTKQYLQNIAWMEEAGVTLGAFTIGAVMCGKTAVDRAYWLNRAFRCAEMICFSFHIPQRVTWWRDFRISTNFNSHKRIHLLGMTSVAELREWVEIAKAYPDISFSLDTCKPLKLGVQGILFTDDVESKNLRGGPVNSKSILDMKDFTEGQERCIIDNIEFLKEACYG